MTPTDAAARERAAHIIYERARDCWSGEFPISRDVADYIAGALMEWATHEAERARAEERERICKEVLLWAHLSSSRGVSSTLESFAKAMLEGKGPFDDETLNEFARAALRPPPRATP